MGVITTELMRNILLALVAIFVCTLLLIANLFTSVIVVVNVFITLVGIKNLLCLLRTKASEFPIF